MKETDILFERGDHWVKRNGQKFAVYKNGLTHATSVIEFEDLSLAIMLCGEESKRPMRAREAVHHAEEILGEKYWERKAK
jgi:hypothetical protein